MINEGMYAESPAMQEMKDNPVQEVQSLMDSGYTMDEASKECMNRFRKDSRYAHDDEFVLSIVLKAQKITWNPCGTREEVENLGAIIHTELNEYFKRISERSWNGN